MTRRSRRYGKAARVSHTHDVMPLPFTLSMSWSSVDHLEVGRVRVDVGRCVADEDVQSTERRRALVDRTPAVVGVQQIHDDHRTLGSLASTSSAVASSGSRVRPHTATWTPSRANATAIAWPMPRPPPVTGAACVIES